MFHPKTSYLDSEGARRVTRWRWEPYIRFVSFRDVVLSDVMCSVWHTRVYWLTIAWYTSEWEHSDIIIAGDIHETEVH